MAGQQTGQMWNPAPLAAANADQVLGVNRRVAHVFLVFLLSIFVTIFPIATHFVSPMLAIGCQFLLVSLMTVYFTPAVPFVILFTLLFQNSCVSIFSDFLTTKDDYNFVRGYNFLTMMIAWLWLYGHYVMNWQRHDRQTNRIMTAGFIAFVVIGLYLVLGMAKNPTGAIIYLRNVITPMVLFQICFLVSQRFSLRAQDFFFSLTIVIVVLGYIEASNRELWLDLTNGWTLLEFASQEDRLNLVLDKKAAISGLITVDILDELKIAFLNTPLLGENSFIITRMSGPNIHPISYAYALSVLAMIMLFTGRYFWFVLLLPLMLLASAKGSLIMLFLATCGLIARKLFGAMVALGGLFFVLVVYFLAGIVVGLDIGDFHVLGFMGGIFDFLSNPIGRGLGDGGNFTTDFGKLDWPAYQAAGRTPFAIESAIGVLLRQMGVASFILLGTYIWIAIQTFKVSLSSRINLHTVMSFALLIMIINGVFQEEALFSPLALGSVMMINGLILGASQRGKMAQT